MEEGGRWGGGEEGWKEGWRGRGWRGSLGEQSKIRMIDVNEGFRHVGGET